MTNKIVLRSTEEFMSDYTPIYQPIYPLFLGKSQLHSAEVGKMEYRRVQTVGDIRAKHISPKTNDLHQVNVNEAKKAFKKYFLANQFTLSDVQNREGAEEVVTQVLDEHQIQFDELFMLGEGTSGSDVLNNGLFYSADPNYTLESSYEIPTTARLNAFHTKVVTNASKANQVAGRKVVLFYGADVKGLYNSLLATSERPVKTVLKEVLGPNYSLVEVPDAPTPSGANGWIIANIDQCKMHYAMLPQLLTQGNNTEKMYLWFNFMLGSSMLEVLAKDAIIRQPTTLAT